MNRSRRWYLLAGGLILAALLAVILVPQWLTPVGPEYRDVAARALDNAPPFPPSARHLLGSDQLGRDVWSRVAYGARWSLFFALLIMTVRLAIAMPVAYAAARRPRTVGWLVGRLYVLTGSIPPLIIYLLVLGNEYIRTLGLWPCATITIALLALVEWPRLAVFLQGRIETLMAQPFMEGAVAVGATSGQIYRQHLRPHLWPIVAQAGAQEVARALLILGQVGVFGIMTGGGVLEDVVGAMGARAVVMSGIPEWGATLADSRKYVLMAPWMVFGPALALFLSICGANWLAQGLEGVAFPLTRWQAATTGRLSARWRWLAVPLMLGALLWYYQGLPWGREQSARDFLADLNPEGKLTYLDVDGAKAEALLNLPGFKTLRGGMQIPNQTTVHLERRWGRWQVTETPWKSSRGYHTVIYSKVMTYDPTTWGQAGRSTLANVASTADRVYERIAALVPVSGRPAIRLMETHEQFLAAIAPATGTALWYTPARDEILVSPEFLNMYERGRYDSAVSQEMLKALRGADEPLSPVALGLLLRQADSSPVYRADYKAMAGAPLFSLEQLFALKVRDLTPQMQSAAAAQSALMIEYLKQAMSQSEVEALARSGGPTPGALSAGYANFLFHRIAEESILTVPAAVNRIPETLRNQASADGAVLLDVEQKGKVYMVYELTRTGVTVKEWTP